MAAAAPYLAIASAGIGAIGAVAQGEAESANAAYQAQVARNNAVIASQYAKAARATGETQAYNAGLRNRQKLGAEVAGFAAAGLDANTGSAADTRENAQQLGLTDVQTVRQQAAQQAYGYKVEGLSDTGQAGAYQAEAAAAPEAGFLKGGGLLLGGLSTVGPKFQALFDSANGGTDLGDWSPRPA